VDDTGVGRAFREVRLRRGITQRQLAARSGCAQSVVSRIERGHLETVTLGRIRAIARELEIRIPLVPSWRGGELARLLDRQHASIVEATVARMTAEGWETMVEATFNEYGERGSIDILGWHSSRSALLVVEVKSRIVDVQGLLAGVDRKARLAPRIATRRWGGRSAVTGVVVVLPASSTSMGIVARHRAIFDAALPARTVAVRRWLADPRTSLRGILFLRDIAPRTQATRPAGQCAGARRSAGRAERSGTRVAPSAERGRRGRGAPAGSVS
jgi:transcriptional regulator with XRE-family HTH domain